MPTTESTGDHQKLRWVQALKDVLANRVPLWLIMWWGVLLVPGSEPVGAGSRSPNMFLAGWFKWDAAFYVNIASYGYNNVPNAFGQRDTHFWPLFPLLMKLTSFVIPGHDLRVAGFALNAVLLFVAVAMFADLAQSTIGVRLARLATALLLAYPFAFYYSAGYTEATFLCSTLAAFHFGVRGRWLVASLCAGVASASRAAAIATPIALIVLYMEQRQWSLRRVRADALLLCLGFIGALEYVALLKIRFNEPFAFTAGLQAKDWGADVTWGRLFLRLRHLFDPWTSWPLSWIDATDLFHLACLSLTIATIVLGRKLLRPYLMVFSIVQVVVASRLWSNGGRYCAPIFPAYLVLAAWLDGRAGWTTFTTTLFVGAQVLFMYMFGHRFWVS